MSSAKIVTLLVAVGSLLTAAGAGAQARPALSTLRYDLRPGDHLIYQEVLERSIDGRSVYGLARPPVPRFGDPVEIRLRAEWTNHLLVLGREDEAIALGVQRNRTSAELLEYRLDGADRTEQERAAWLAVWRGKERFAAANLVSPSGSAQLPESVVREWTSKVLWMLGEVLPLPETGGRPPLGLKLGATVWESIEGEDCLRVEWVGSGHPLVLRTDSVADALHLRYWFCPTSGLLRRVDFDAFYPTAAFQKVHEHATLELIARTRGEQVGAWIAAADLQQGALAAMAVADRIPVDAETLLPLVESGDSVVQRQALGVWFRRRLPPLPADRFASLVQSTDLGLRRLAVLITEPDVSDDPAAAPTSAGSREPLTDCAVDSGWGARVAGIRRAPAQTPGTTLRTMTAKGFEGWPYVVRVPDDYRGDRPFPLLLYLAGNAGPAIEGALLAQEGVAPTDYLVVYPNAAGPWWWPQPTDMVDALLTEILRDFNVDPERIYLSGLSNGGTGAFYYSTIWPDRFTAAVVAMGAGMFAPNGTPLGDPMPLNAGRLPMLFLHGAEDRVIQVEAMTATVQLMKPRVAPLETHVFKDRGHEIILGRGDDGMTLAFLEAHQHREMPRSLLFQLPNLNFPRSYWVEVLEKEGESASMEGGDTSLAARVNAVIGSLKVAEVKAQIEKNNTVRVETKNIRRLRLLLRPDLFPTPGPVRIKLNGKTVFEGEVRYDCVVLKRSLEETGDPYLAYSATMDLAVPDR